MECTSGGGSGQDELGVAGSADGRKGRRWRGDSGGCPELDLNQSSPISLLSNSL